MFFRALQIEYAVAKCGIYVCIAQLEKRSWKKLTERFYLLDQTKDVDIKWEHYIKPLDNGQCLFKENFI